ncbi:adenylate kinase [Catenulispora sp. EB89]|uniref:adenylate kinase n=1 Tax=Catenulispora sp. EB89 TaxID=3156257 RepID=UPI0035128C57
MRIVLVGPPGAGKGTQASFIAGHLGVPKISTGDIFRMNISQGTPLGVQAKEYLDAGQLVPDELTIDIVRDRLSQPDAADGFLLDGFPRNVAQAEELDKILADNGVTPSVGKAYLDVVLDLEVDNNEVIKRISGRRLCRNDSGHIFHVDYSPSAAGDKCEICGGELYQRSDDAEDVVRTRLEVYAAETAPIIDYYREQGVLTTIDATGEVDVITRRAFAAVDAARG